MKPVTPEHAPDVLVMGATKAMSYGPRIEPYDDGIVMPAKSAEDAEFWAVYEWRPSKHVLEGGWWEWIADCDTEDVARKIAEAIAVKRDEEIERLAEALRELEGREQRDKALLRREAHPAITHCDNCGCDWLDNGLNPIGCPYCKLSVETEVSRRTPTKEVDFFAPGARLALELECLLLDTRDAAVQSRWWDSAYEALEQWRQAVRTLEAAIDAAQPQSSTTLEEAASHARVCSGLAEQYKSDPVLFAALTDAAAIIRDLMCELRGETERRWEGNRRAAQEYVDDMRDVLKEAARVCKDLDDEALAKENRLACGAECAAAIADLAARMNVPFEEHEHDRRD